MKRRPTSHCCVTKDLLVKLICGLLAVRLPDVNDSLDGNRNDAPVRTKPKGYCLSLFLTETILDQISWSRLRARRAILQPVVFIADLSSEPNEFTFGVTARDKNGQKCITPSTISR